VRTGTVLFLWATVVNRGYYAWKPPRKKRVVRLKSAIALTLNMQFLRDETEQTRKRKLLKKVGKVAAGVAAEVKPVIKNKVSVAVYGHIWTCT
jgi:hypothetical protein